MSQGCPKLEMQGPARPFNTDKGVAVAWCGLCIRNCKKITFGELGLRGVTTGERRGNLPQEVAGEQIRGHGSSHSKLLSCR